jgi:hypothetical protein
MKTSPVLTRRESVRRHGGFFEETIVKSSSKFIRRTKKIKVACIVAEERNNATRGVFGEKVI